jgi:trimeric autotransporter adhesin
LGGLLTQNTVIDGTASNFGLSLLNSNLNLSDTNSTGTSGVITFGGLPFVSKYGINNSFFGTFNSTTIGLTGKDNTGTGAFSLKSLTSGDQNTAVGVNSLEFNTEGYLNTAIGAQSLNFNTTGWENTATGYAAMLFNTEGYLNSAYGRDSLYSNTNGFGNTANGAFSMRANDSGFGNTANGLYSLSENLSGNYNTSVGNLSLGYNQLGSYNTGLGANAGFNNISGDWNLAIGANTEFANPTSSYQLNIANNIFGIGLNGSVNSPAGYVGIGTAAPTDKLTIDSGLLDNSGLTFSQLSDSTPTSNVNNYLGFDNTGKVVKVASPEIYTAGTGISLTGSVFANTGVLTASNGLTVNGSNVALGGNLIQDTVIQGNGSNYNLTLNQASLFVNSGNLDDSGLTLSQFSNPTTDTGVTDYLGFNSLGKVVKAKTPVASVSNGLTQAGSVAILGGLLNQQTIIDGGLTNITLNLTNSNLNLDGSNADGSAGIITFGSTPFVSNFGTNTFLGYSGNRTTTGIQNTATGLSALQYLTSGWNNSAYGLASLQQNTIGGGNSAFGGESLRNNTTGIGNSAFGLEALFSNISGDINTAIGQNALYNLTSGSINTAIGFQAGRNLISGNQNVAIGFDSQFADPNGSNQLNIGNNIFGTGLNGNIGVPAGLIGIGTSTPTDRLTVNSGLLDNSGLTFSQLSDSTPTSNVNNYLGFDNTGKVVKVASPTGGSFGLATSGITAGTYNNLTIDSFGRATAGSNVSYLTSAITSLNGSTGSLTLSGTNSIVGNGTSTPFALSGDATSPGNSYYYGTDDGGTKGYYTLPSAGPCETCFVNGGNSFVGTAILGTTNARPLSLITDNLERLRIQTTANANNQILIISGGDLDLNNINAGYGLGTNRLLNTAFGVDTLLQNTSGFRNTGFGTNVLKANTTGGDNAGFGSATLLNNTSGYNNTGFGSSVLNFNTTGSQNTAIGTAAMLFNSTGSSNTALGNGAIYFNSIGNNNTGIGDSVMNDSRGNNNTVVGSASLYRLLNGNGNSVFGYSSGGGLLNGSNNTFLGANINTTDISNNIILADGQGNQRINVIANGNVGINNTIPTDKLTVNSGNINNSGLTFSQLSDATLTSTATNYLGFDNTGKVVKVVSPSGGSSYTAGTGLSLTGSVFANTGVLGLTAGSGITNTGTTTNPILGLATSGITAGTYNNLTIDSFGRATAGSNISYLTSAVTSLNGSTGTLTLSATNSIVGNGTSTPFSLAGDSATPGNSFYYGTNAGGAKGYYTLPISGPCATCFVNGGNSFGGLTSIGTNDNNTLSLKTNGTEKMKIFSLVDIQNTILTITGGDALINGVNIGTGKGNDSTNTVLGKNAFIKNLSDPIYSTYRNVAIGDYALYEDTTGYYNTAVGSQALRNNVTGFGNTAVGTLALNRLTDANRDTAIGTSAGFNLTTGRWNTAIGAEAFFSATTGERNTVLGTGAGGSITTGNDNLIIGIGAGITTGSGNLILGSNINAFGQPIVGYASSIDALNTGNYNTIIGNNITGLSSNLSNNIIIGDGNGNRRINVDAVGLVGIGNTTPTNKLTVDDLTTTNVAKFNGSGSTQCTIVTGTGLTCSSDERLKDGIVTGAGLDQINQLRGVQYYWNNGGTLQNGFIAQEVANVIPNAVTTDSNGYLSLNQNAILPVAVNAIKELDTKVKNLENKINTTSQSSISSATTSSANNINNTSINNNPSIFEQITTFVSGVVVKGTAWIQDLIVKGSTVFQGRVEFQDRDMSGQATILANQSTIFVPYTNQYSKTPVVTITGLGHGTLGYVLTSYTNGFTIKVDQLSSQDLRFNWIAISNGMDNVVNTISSIQTSSYQTSSSQINSVSSTTSSSSQSALPSLVEQAPSSIPNPVPTFTTSRD